VEIQLHTLTLDHELLARAAEFARQVARLNRNTNRLGDPHVPVGLITDDLEDVYAFRKVDREPPNYPVKFVGTCWTGDRHLGATMIWINPFAAGGSPRTHSMLVETLSHELAHAFTRGKHGFTFRRMYALLSPHVYEAFGVTHHWYHVYDMITRYGRSHDTYRVNAESLADAWVTRDQRYDEEHAKHKAASLRMSSRLTRERVVL
jgi:hypothetical protein